MSADYILLKAAWLQRVKYRSSEKFFWALLPRSFSMDYRRGALSFCGAFYFFQVRSSWHKTDTLRISTMRECHCAKHHKVSADGLISAAEGRGSLVSIVVDRHPGVVHSHEVAVFACSISISLTFLKMVMVTIMQLASFGNWPVVGWIAPDAMSKLHVPAE